MSAAYLNSSVGDKHHRKITDLNVCWPLIQKLCHLLQTLVGFTSLMSVDLQLFRGWWKHLHLKSQLSVCFTSIIQPDIVLMLVVLCGSSE